MNWLVLCERSDRCFQYTFITNKFVVMRVSSFIQKRLQKASETPRPEMYASFVSCQHLDKPFL